MLPESSQLLVNGMVGDGDRHDMLSDGAISECLRTCNDYVHSDAKKLLLASFLCREMVGICSSSVAGVCVSELKQQYDGNIGFLRTLVEAG